MNKQPEFTIRFADISIRFIFPSKVGIPCECQNFLWEKCGKADVEYEIRLLDQPLELAEKEVGSYMGMKVFRTKDGYLRQFAALTAEDGCQVACLLKNDDKNILYYPSIKWGFYAKELHFLH